MEAEELLKKIRELEEGQAELKREIGKLIPERRGAQSASSRRHCPAPPPQLSPSRRAVAALPQSLRLQRESRAGLSDRHYFRILQSLGQAVHIISIEGKLLYWNRYAEHLYGYSASEAIGQDALELIVDPGNFGAANDIIRNIFKGKCWRGKFPVRNKLGERFYIIANNTPLNDDDGSLVGLICLSIDVRTLEEIIGPSTSAKSYPNSAKPRFQVNNRSKSGLLNKGSIESQQPLQSAITSKITTLASKVTSRVRSRIRTGQNCNEQYGCGCESQYSEHDAREELTSSEASTPSGDVLHGAFVTEENSPGKSSKTNSDDSGEGKVGLHKIFSSKAEAILAKKGISWPWRGHENDGGYGKNNMTSPQLHDKQENDQSHQAVSVPEPIIIPDCQDTEYIQASKYEVSGSWWSFNNNSTRSVSSTGSTNSSATERVDYEADCLDYEILWEDLVIGEQVGQGSCGTVYHALWYGSDVAVKVFSQQEYSQEMILTFRQEVSLMKKLRHPNIILFMGVVASMQRLCVVTEFLPRGSLFHLLQKNTAKVDPRRRVHMAIDIARGMNYLHHSSPPVVHRDLKSSNLLVDKNWTVKVADFGLSRLKLETFLTTKTGKGTPQWMAPEVLRNEPSNEKSDVYSYGVILWELVTQKIPWDNLNTMQVVGAVGFMDHRLDIPSDTDPQWASMIESCWERGRGSRAVLKWLKNGTVVHDASYFIPIQLDGPEDSLLSILRMVLCPSPADETPGLKHLQDQVMRGVCCENAMLWRVGSPHSQIVGPVTYMWRPFSKENGKLEPKGDLTNSHRFYEGSFRRQLWIWIHPAALDEGLNAIRFACEKQMQDSDVVVNCCSLEGKIARLEVMGCKAMQSLQSILHPISNSSMINRVLNTSAVSTSTDPLDSSTGSHLLKSSVVDHAEILQPGAILSMIVRDPREVSAQGTDSSSKPISPNQDNKLLEENLVPNADGAPLEEKNILSSMWMHPGRHDLLLSDCRELWDSSYKINPPVAEEILCMEKHHRRIKFFCLDSGNDKEQATQEKGCFSRSCPIVLLKHAKEGVLSLGWSVILPLSWVKPFWLFLVSHGAHAIGLRERRWIASKFRMPCFPYDYPDSKAYSSFMTKEAAAFDKAAECCPAAMRPPRVPVPPLWHCIKASFCKGDGLVRGLEVDDLNLACTILPECSPVNSNSGDAESLATNVFAPFQLLVPRTIQMLRQYVKEYDMKYLSSLSDMETYIGQPNLVSGGAVKMTVSELCLVRVLIRALKEGSFEEGAVVCAPFSSDLSAWRTRSEEECVEKWELQLPQSHVSSYFSWLDPSTRNLQLPKDDTTVKAFRWPIGFVTTGFVHGSSGQDAVAVAFCEARLLAVLRRQQWTHEGWHGQDICVLVRNARSAAYRRALATVVLEQQKGDLEFM